MSGQTETKSMSTAMIVLAVVVVAAFVAVLVILIVLIASPSTRINFFTTQQAKLVGTGNTGFATQGWSTAINQDGTTLAVGGVDNDTAKGAVWVFVRASTTNIWTQQQILIPVGLVPDDLFGSSVAISNDGNTIIASAGAVGGFEGGVWIFDRVGTVWTENAVGKILPVTYPLVGASNGFGYSLSFRGDGNMFVAGATSDNGGIGAAYVYEKVSNVWTEKQKLIGTGAVGAASQGHSVSTSEDGNVIVIGGIADSANVGATWIFTRSGATYVQAQKIVGTDASGASRQGRFVSLSATGNILAVSGNTDNTSLGAVWMFKREGALWVQEGAKLVGTGLVGTSNFGFKVVLNGEGNILVASCPSANTDEGGFFAFINNGSGWVQKENRKTLPSGMIGPSFVGGSLSMSRDGKTLAVGARKDNADQGAVFVFV